MHHDNKNTWGRTSGDCPIGSPNVAGQLKPNQCDASRREIV